jgi:hypothetical protein
MRGSIFDTPRRAPIFSEVAVEAVRGNRRAPRQSLSEIWVASCDTQRLGFAAPLLRESEFRFRGSGVRIATSVQNWARQNQPFLRSKRRQAYAEARFSIPMTIACFLWLSSFDLKTPGCLCPWCKNGTLLNLDALAVRCATSLHVSYFTARRIVILQDIINRSEKVGVMRPRERHGLDAAEVQRAVRPGTGGRSLRNPVSWDNHARCSENKPGR